MAGVIIERKHLGSHRLPAKVGTLICGYCGHEMSSHRRYTKRTVAEFQCSDCAPERRSFGVCLMLRH